MDDPAQARAYAQADFEEPNARFVATFSRLFRGFRGGVVLDLGCGPADIAIRFARRYERITITAVDGSSAMLRLARQAVRDARLVERICPIQWRIGTQPVPPGLAHSSDAVFSNSLLHHMANPAAFWLAIRDCAKKGAPVLVMDLLRPASPGVARRIVSKYSAGEPAILRRDFYNSLRAAFRVEELRAQIRAAGLDLTVEPASDRHWVAYGRAP
jgi:ubiquinone/menaquinone biosynthesis C-methylase UbiE